MDRLNKELIENNLVLARWENVDESDDELEDNDPKAGSDALEQMKKKKAKQDTNFLSIFEKHYANDPNGHFDKDNDEKKVSKMAASMIASEFLFGNQDTRKLDKKDKEIVQNLLNTCLCDRTGKYQYSILKGNLKELQTKMAGTYDDDDDDEDGNTKLKMTMEQNFEFKVAFSVVAGLQNTVIDEKIHISQIDEVFQACGLTMQEYDLEYVTEYLELDEEENVSYDNLRDAFEQWRLNQLQLPVVKALYNMFIVDKTVPKESEFPRRFVNKNPGEATISHKAIENALNKIMHLHGKSMVTKTDLIAVVDEFTSTGDRKITFSDFCGLFTSMSMA
jgi:uncharacterized protein YggL (DUF469 family)